MSSSFAREVSAPPSKGSNPQSAAAPTPTTTTSATANNNRSPSGSPQSQPDAGRASNQTRNSSSDSNSPMPRLSAVLRPPPATSSAAGSSSTTTATQAQTQPSQNQGGPATTTGGPSGNRENTGISRRHAYPHSSAYGSAGASGSSSSMPMQSQYFNSEGGRLTTGSSSYNRLSPVSSPAMAGESWAAAGPRGVKRHLQPYGAPMYDGYGAVRTVSSVGGLGASMRLPSPQAAMQNTASIGTPSTTMSRRGTGSNNGTTVTTSTSSGARIRPAGAQPTYAPPKEDPMQYEPAGEARHPRDSTRYETWTSKQLRKKCSHLKLRGLKNVKKHVMVEALYRYYRNQRLKDMADAASVNKNSGASQNQSSSPQQQPSQRRLDIRRPSSLNGNSMAGGRSDLQYRSRYDQRGVGAQSQYGSHSSRSRGYGNYGSQSPSPPSSGGDSGGSQSQRQGPLPNSSGYYLDEEAKNDSHFKEVPVTSEDVIRLVDVVLSPEFVDRLAAELSRWQFWVDIREMYIALLNRQHPPGSAGAGGEGGPVGSGGSATNSRNFKWSSMQLWEIWKELSFAYTKTCFEFTAAGVDDREYINFCEGRPDVYYLHQRLHARPDLLHLIKSNEYIDEKCTSEASESIAHEQQQAQQQQQAGPLVGSGSPLLRGHKRYKRTVPMTGTGPTSAAYNSARAISAYRDGSAGVDGSSGVTSGATSGDNGSGQGSRDSRGHSPEENSTENSETTGEEGSSNTANSNASNSSLDVSMRAALAEQKYFGLLLQNFEVIFESLHNKKVLLATLRKDNKAPDHLIADLHDDIHVLSALKKEFRSKLRHTMQ